MPREAVRLLVLLACLASLTSGCALRGRVHVFPRCADGLPPKVFIDLACPPDGICGYSCLPDRWGERDTDACRPESRP